MQTLAQELLDISIELEAFIAKAEIKEVLDPLNALENSAKAVGRAWSKSWIGYHANVYYEGLQPPPPGAHFSSEWGFINDIRESTSGQWVEFDYDSVIAEILNRAKHPNTELAGDIASEGQKLFIDKKDAAISIIEAIRSQYKDAFLDEMSQQAKQLQLFSEGDFVAHIRPSQSMSRDSLAVSQGLWTPPHISILAKVDFLRCPGYANKQLADIAEKTAAHIRRITTRSPRTQTGGNMVFIGHGRSNLWKELRDFIQYRLKIEWDEYNRVPIAGITNSSRLSGMLDTASIAFIVMTAEDELADGKTQPRMNVIHEAGLFQGRLGFTKAIVLLEDGCEEFSNIQGLGQIRFPKGKINESFEDIRSVLEREGIISS